MSTNILMFKISLLLYVVATIFFFVDVLARREQFGKAARWLLISGFVVHLGGLGLRYHESGQVPVANLPEALSFFSWAIVGIYLLFDLRYRLAVLGAFVCPMAVAMMLVSSAVPMQVQPANPLLDSWWFPIHVGLAFFGYAVFTLSAAAGVIYLLQERMLKSKKFSSLYHRLPSLEVLDTINYRCLTFGFPLMTMGIISGAVWANMAWGGYWRWDPKETWALITWFLYAALLHGRLTIGWRGRKAAIFALIGFSCLLFSLLAVNLLMSDEHSFKALQGLPKP